MRKITMWMLSTVAVIVLLFSYRTSTGGGSAQAAPIVASTPATTGSAATADPTATATSSPSAASSSAASGTGKSATPSATKTSAAPVTKTYTGATASTRWGDVQVVITVTDNKITNVAVPVYPSGNGRDAEINANALPTLTQETLQAQSANIETVSGATVTSNGYLQSLQSALDAAHLS